MNRPAGRGPPTRSHAINATWNTYEDPNAWTTAGGDFAATPESTNMSVGPTPGVYSWYPTNLAVGWHNGTMPNNGMLLKATNEAAANLLTFTSYDAAANEPALWLWWTPQWGRHGYFKFESQDLAERLNISVNVANGNLLVGASDVSVAGTGIDLGLGRTYNSLDGNTRRFGRGTSWIAGLVIQQNGVLYYGDTGEKAHFLRNDDGTYQRPMGFDATLVKNGDGSFTLTDHGSSVKEQFRADGRLTAIADPNGNQISFAINAGGFPYQITDTRGRTWTLRYNAQNLIDLITESASSRTWAYEYDGNGNLTTFTNPAAGVTRYEYDGSSRLVGVVSPNGRRTLFTYDYPAGRVVSIQRETGAGVGPLTEFTYNSGNTVVTDPNGKQTTHHYDSSLRPTRTVDPLGNNVSATYTSNSNVETYTGGSSAVTQNGYDTNFNLTSARLPTGATARWEFTDPAHKYLSTRALDEQGHATSMAYDSRTNMTSLTNAASGQAVYTYNANGTVATARDFKNNATSFNYDTAGNLTLVDNPAPLGDVSYTYDSLSRVKTTTDGKSQTTTFAYDTLDRVTSMTYSGGATITYGYDANGNRTSTADNTGTTTYGYDVLDRLTSENGPTTSVSYGYDAAGNMTSLTDNNGVGGTITYGYNAANLLTTLTDAHPGSLQTTFSYDADHLRTQTNYPNGVSMFFTYDQSNRLTRVQGKKPASGLVLTDYVYSWTNGSGQDTGLRQSVTDKDGNRTSYTYDVLNRLTLAEERSSAGSLLNSWAYGYDANSNRTSQTANGVTTSYSHNAADQLTAAGSTTFSYDGNGNELSNSAGRQWTYNAKDQATSVTPAGGSAISMSYAGAGQFDRVSAGSTTYDSSALGLTRENLDAYVHDDAGMLLFRKTPGSGTHYYLLDGLGSVVALTDSLGGLAATYSYEPFGKLKSSTGTVTTPYRWLGGLGVYHDTASGLYKMGTRYYDPALGRFTQVDPVRGGAATAYDYAAQDPINNADLDGTVVFKVCVWGFGAGCKNPARTAWQSARKVTPVIACLVLGGSAWRLFQLKTKGNPILLFGRWFIRAPHVAAGGCIAGFLYGYVTKDLPGRRK